MKIRDVIQKIKDYHYGYVPGETGSVRIDDRLSRDRILYGDAEKECTGIVTTCWANMDVIREAGKRGANLIICHEALFWNHGDHTEWLRIQQNRTFSAKTALLDQYGITVWRDHDYIHSGIPMDDGSYADGIFLGLADALGWRGYIDWDSSALLEAAHGWDGFAAEGKRAPLAYVIPPMKASDVAEHLTACLNLNGAKIIGDPDRIVSRVSVPFHIFGDANPMITMADEGKADCFLSMELIDYTLTEYVRDSAMTGTGPVIIGVGHFNLEEPGMRYMVNWLPKAIGDAIPCSFVQSGDNYSYILRKAE